MKYQHRTHRTRCLLHIMLYKISRSGGFIILEILTAAFIQTLLNALHSWEPQAGLHLFPFSSTTTEIQSKAVVKDLPSRQAKILKVAFLMRTILRQCRCCDEPLNTIWHSFNCLFQCPILQLLYVISYLVRHQGDGVSTGQIWTHADLYRERGRWEFC